MNVPAADGGDLGAVTVLIPARDEADVIATTLEALGAQGRNLVVVVVDDRSTDATARIAKKLAARGAAPSSTTSGIEIRLIAGAELPEGWSGKLWALQQGLHAVDRPYTLLLDADIQLSPGVVTSLLRHAKLTDAQLVSLMATLRCSSLWERLLVPPFVYFFKLLYPFARVNSDLYATAAAAGGCILIETSVLREVGFAGIRGALIDDCALAGAVKSAGYKIWLGLSRSVRSRRAYLRLEDFSRMVRRTAFTQLGCSTWLLLGVTLAMLILYVVPFGALIGSSSLVGRLVAAGALAAMYLSFAPIVRFYEQNAFWTLSLPVAAVLFLFMTWGSALNYWRGTRAEWKNRAYVARSE